MFFPLPLLASGLCCLLYLCAPVCSQEAPSCKTQKGPCACETDQGLVDLSPLDSKDKLNPKFKDIPESGSMGHDSFSFNPCTAFTEEDCTDVAACQVRHDGGVLYYPTGTQTTAAFTTDPTDGLMITYSAVGSDGETRKTNLMLNCDRNEEGSLTASGETSLGSKIYVLTITSKYACPSSVPPPSGGQTGLSPGSILCIVFLALVTVYVIGGVVFNAVIRGARGVEMVPNVSFWKDMPILVKDGAMFVVGKARGGNSQYENV